VKGGEGRGAGPTLPNGYRYGGVFVDVSQSVGKRLVVWGDADGEDMP